MEYPVVCFINDLAHTGFKLTKIIKKLIFCKHHRNYYSDCIRMNYIPKGLPEDLNLMLLLEDANLKQECDEIVQNGTMDCMKKIVSKLRDKIQYDDEKYTERNEIFFIRMDVMKENDYPIQSTQKWIN